MLFSWRRCCGGSFWKKGWRRAWSEKKEGLSTLLFHVSQYQRLTESHSSAWIVVQHVADNVKKLQMLWSVVDHIAVERLRVISDISPSGRFFVPVKFSMIEIFCFRFSDEEERIPMKKVQIKVTSSYLAIFDGSCPSMRSIIAKCSRLSCVWKSVIPKYNSNMMQPIDHTSQGWAQPSSKITSGAR